MVEYTYNAWGVLLSTTGSMASTLGLHNPLRYRGYVYDPETALYYLQSRYYDPDVGRFINADAFASTGQGLLGNNMFAYCRNNPVSRIDPSGTYDRCLADDNPWDLLLNGVCGGGGAGGGYIGYGYIGGGSAYNTYQIRSLTANYDAMLGGYHSNGLSSAYYKLGSYYVPSAVTVTDVDAIPVKGTSQASNPLDNIIYSEKVVLQQQQQKDFHGLPKIVDNYDSLGTRSFVIGGDGRVYNCLKISGTYNGYDGNFVYMWDSNGSCNHRCFEKNHSF